MVAKIDKVKVGTFAARAFYSLLKTSLEENTIYAGVHYIPDSDWTDYTGSADSEKNTDSESTFWGGIDSDFDNNDRVYYNQTMYSMHKVFPGGISRVISRIDWNYGNYYNSYPQSNSYVLVKGYESGFATLNVYLCLHSPNLPSYYAPSGSSTVPIELSDGYVWKYLYSITNSQAIRFLNESWMPVPEKIPTSEFNSITTDSTNYNQYITQVNAEQGTVHGVQLDSDLIKTTFNSDSALSTSFGIKGNTLELIGRDIVSNRPTQDFKVNLRFDSDTSRYYTTFVQAGKGYIGPVNMTYDLDSEIKTFKGVTATVAPGAGFGSNIAQELQANSIMISVRNFPDTESSVVYNGNKYNMITLHLSPIDTKTKLVAQDEFYVTCNYFSTTNNVEWASGNIIKPYINDDGRRGLVVSVKDNIVYYITTAYGTELDTFKDNELLSLVSGEKQNRVKQAYNRNIVFNSSDLLVADYKAQEVTRNEGQIESFNFILTF